MKNTKEVKAILTALYCINFASKNRDNDIESVIEYAFMRLLDANTNMLVFCCVGKSKEQIMLEVMQVMGKDTDYKKYLERRIKNESNY